MFMKFNDIMIDYILGKNKQFQLTYILITNRFETISSLLYKLFIHLVRKNRRKTFIVFNKRSIKRN